MKHLNEIAGSIVMGCLLVTPIAATAGDFKGDVKDAWLEGKIETTYTLNKHLNPFSIKTEVRGSKAYLAGSVESDIDRDLAAELALAVEGVSEVENNITVQKKAAMMSKKDQMMDKKSDSNRSFSQVVDDATTTAAIKSKFAVNGNVSALDIDIDTRNDVVTLRGTVDSDEEKDLAEAIALNVSDTDKVRNKLKVRSKS